MVSTVLCRVCVALSLMAAVSARGTCLPDDATSDWQDCALRQLTLQEDAVEVLVERLRLALPLGAQRRLAVEQARWWAAREARCENLLAQSTHDPTPDASRPTVCRIKLTEQRAQQLMQRLARAAAAPPARH